MRSSRSGPPEGELLRCADVLGAFGVGPADLRALDGEATALGDTGESVDELEAILAEQLADARDRTAFVRQTICRSDRGMACGARYAHDELDGELSSMFEAIGWAFESEETVDGLECVATDPKGRRRETTVTYPETPLGEDNLPAVLYAINDTLLDGTDGRLVLLSSGVDRWRAALIDVDELDRLTDQYGPRVGTFDRPLLPDHDPAAYVPEASEQSTSRGDSADEPWPAWAIERAERRSTSTSDRENGSIGTETRRDRTRGGDIFRIEEPDGDDDDGGLFSGADRSGIFGSDSAETDETSNRAETSTQSDEPDRSTGIGSLIDEAESGPEPASESESNASTSDAPKRATTESRVSTRGLETESTSTTSTVTTESTSTTSTATTETKTAETDTSTTSATSSEIDGFTLNGSATVSRVSDDDRSDESRSDEGRSDTTPATTDDSDDDDDGWSLSGTTDDSDDDDDGWSLTGTADDSDDDDDGWSLSGTTKTTRVSNDSFGTDDTLESEDEQYQALGAALTTGEDVSVSGLLEDDEFLPELPAVEPEETRLTFEDSFDPDAVGKAKAAAEESGFVWVDSGSMETKRVSNS